MNWLPYHDLQIDLVLSENQLRQRYRQELDPKCLIAEAMLAKSHGSKAYQNYRFVCLSKHEAKLRGAALRHLAGVAEMRFLLRTRDWLSKAHTADALLEPDAIWFSGTKEIAIEYDTGSYSASQRQAKFECFSQFDEQIWGSPSLKRVARLNEELRPFGGRALYASWC